MARVIYWVMNGTDVPTGGVKAIFQHVALLRAAGIEAWAAIDPATLPSWCAHDVPVLDSTADLPLRPDDHLVMPEVSHQLMHAVARTRARKLVFCQNHYLVFHGLRDTAGWGALGIEAVLAASPVIADFVRLHLDVPLVAVTPPLVDETVFRPAAVKTPMIVCIPTKRRQDAVFIHGLLRRRHPALATVPWRPLAGVPESDIAAALAQGTVLLALGWREGLGLPPLEAMAAGCAVVGFTGGGGRSYASAANGWWLDDDDLVGCVDALAGVLDGLADGDGAVLARVAAGRATARAYDRAATSAALLAFWRDRLG